MDIDDQIPDLVPDNDTAEPVEDEPTASTANEEDEFVTVTSKREHTRARKRKILPASSSASLAAAAPSTIPSTEASSSANVSRVVPMRLVGVSRPPTSSTASSSKRQRSNTGTALSVAGSTASQSLVAREMRRIPIPSNRFAPLKTTWPRILAPLVEHLRLQVRVNTRARVVEVRTCEATREVSALQKAVDFLNAFMLGFELEDALSLVRLDDLYVESFDIEDVKPLKGDHLSRAIGRLAGHGGRTKFAIENATRTRIVIHGHRVHLLGSFANIAIARRALSELVLGAPPSKLYGRLRNVYSKLATRL